MAIVRLYYPDIFFISVSNKLTVDEWITVFHYILVAIDFFFNRFI